MTEVGQIKANQALRDVFARWIETNVAGDLDGVCALYHPQAIFWGTISPFLRTTPDEVRDYFHMFFNPVAPMKILHHHTELRVYGNIGMNSGSYTFYFPATNGVRTIDARYSFAYELQNDGGWLIVDHHSSKVPLL